MRTVHPVYTVLFIILAALALAAGCTILQINSEPQGADVSLDGNLTGQKTNCEIDTNPGVHLVRLTKYGYEPYVTQAVVADGETTVVRAILVPQGGGTAETMRLVSEKTITVPKNCYAYYKYILSPGTQVKTEVIAAGSMYGFSTLPQGFDEYLRIVNAGATSASGVSSMNEHQWGKRFTVTNFEPEGYTQRKTYYFVLDNTPIGYHLTYSDSLPSAGGSVLVRIFTNDPAFTILADSAGCMPHGS